MEDRVAAGANFLEIDSPSHPERAWRGWKFPAPETKRAGLVHEHRYQQKPCTAHGKGGSKSPAGSGNYLGPWDYPNEEFRGDRTEQFVGAAGNLPKEKALEEH
ncbi:hypothetical protein N7532_004307 [Penicillium argentinense]|uniref:Uncharacterized protein n=1 Tax=Penicillium argentinense TaxID=1131581 RepID=A0A9W9FP48_9EURO|nr:uncharacterized protein N7532_004307 [Penicillium argentinense]KAJ5103778.1 hypothetical protein N7532_004307 [Penicillium argentinense]